MSRRIDLRRQWYEALVIAPAILVLALLPSTLYIDHWSGYLSQTSVGAELEEPGSAESATHHSHCHSGPGSCADQPIAPNSQVFPTIVELSAPDLPTVLQEVNTAHLEETVLNIPTEPPRL